MTVTIDSPFRSTPRISRAGFVAVLERAGSFASDPLWAPTPRAERPAEAGRIYDLIASRGHDPAVWLGVAGREHTFGTNRNSVLWRCNTRSWTNARSVRDPSLTGWEIVTDPVRRSQYVRYASVMDSVRDGLYRVDDPTFAYAGKTTILEVIQTWAPSSDGNAPRAYAEQVARWINEWAAEFPPEGKAMTDDPQAQWMPSSNYTKGREGRWVSRLTGKSIGGGFLSYYEWLIQQIGEAEAIMLIGHPLTEEIRENGLVVQYFERARFEWHPGSRPERWDVLLGRLGAERLEQSRC